MPEPSELGSSLYRGTIIHTRLKPKLHRFRYRVFSLLLDLDELPSLASRLKLFSYNSFGVFSFYDCDHGRRDGSALRSWVEKHLNAAGLNAAGVRIKILCFPRLFGYVFNPLSIYFCYEASGRLGAVLYEVKNTFGQQHGYLFGIPSWDVSPLRHHCAKRFYVSPFMPVSGTYSFHLGFAGESLDLAISLQQQDGISFVARHSAHAQALYDRALASVLLTYPAMTLRVIVGIHWQALCLFFKGLKIHPRPPLPPTEVDYFPELKSP